eukprot:TRINITY_DN47597_c0_g1_i1.p1 TRINITY_DN47597_c0_g1~~TRINITY_DN47597_c0_g1_i1.p1  ORF type:complete len:547 (+),score=179.59 TRINITY_DN47597_c0_g1_i1:79-1719(+)
MPSAMTRRVTALALQMGQRSGADGGLQDIEDLAAQKSLDGCGGGCSATAAASEPPVPWPASTGSGRIDSAAAYLASLRGRNLKVYLAGKLIKEPAEHPIIWPSVNAVAETYRLMLEEPELGAAESHLVPGLVISRFLNVCMSADQVVRQSLMQRRLGQRTGTCFQRCVGMDAINTLFSTTYDVDAAKGTQYHSRFVKFLTMLHRGNFVLGGAMTDPKGDRSKGPAKQHDLDLHVRVVGRREGGIVLRGAKMHQTGCVNSHWLAILPGGTMRKGDEQFAIACALPVDAPGVSYIYGRQSCDLRAMEGEIDQGNARFGGQEAIVVFDDVFVPTERIFMDGEVEFCGELVDRFTSYHRRSYICKAGLGDVLTGATAAAAEYNGVQKASHIKDKLVEMTYLSENIAGTALAASHRSRQNKAGNWEPDRLMANVCKHNVTRFPYEIARLAQDIAGGLVGTLPHDEDFSSAVTGPTLYKYLATTPKAHVDHRRRVMRLIENMTLGRNAVGYLTESLHGAGSPQAQRVLIQRVADWEAKKRYAKRIAGIPEGQ